MQALPVHDRVRGVRVAQVVKPRVRHDPGRVARPGPERPKVICTQRPVPLAARKHPLPGRCFGESVQQLPRRLAEQNVPRSGLRVNQGEPVGLDLAPPQAPYLSRPAPRQKQAHCRDADRVFAFALAQDRAELRQIVRAKQPNARRTPIADDTRARVPGGFGAMAPRDGAVEHGVQYVMTSIRPARLPAPVFVEEAGNIGPHHRADAEMAESGQDGAVEIAQGRLDRGRLPRRRAPLDVFRCELRQRRAGSGKGTGLPPPLSRARKASAAARAWSAFTASGLPSVTRRGVPSRRKWNTQDCAPLGCTRSMNPTRVPIEGKESMRWLENLRRSTELLGDPARCVHVCDREGDIWELFCLAEELGTHFVIRRCSDRFAGDGSDTVEAIMAEEKVRGLHSVAVRDDKGKLGSTQVELSYRRMTILPPIAKRKRYPALSLTVLHAREPEEPVGRPRIDWKLITDLPVESHADAVGKLHWYAMRWKIEIFHNKIMKSGCRAEQARLRTAERLGRLLAVFCILSWRVFWLTMLNRAMPDLEPAQVLTGLETKILDRLIPDSTADPPARRTISLYLIKIARLGGYLARTKDPPPGNIVMWRGLSRLNDIALGATLQIDDVGN